MTIDVIGPASTNAVTTRPASTTTYGASRTYFKACSSPAAQDGTFITNDWLNLILAQLRDVFDGAGIVEDNGDDMLWRAIEVMAPRYAVDTGAANALVITDTPPIPAMRAGLVLAVKVLHTNTTASTITFDGETAVPIVNWADASALGAGALVAGGTALMIGDDAGNLRLINSALSGGGGGGGGGTGGGLAGAVSGLTGSAAGMTKTATWTAQEVSAEVSLGGTSLKGANLTLNLNCATNGANGFDTGSVPANADVSVYAILNPTGGAGGGQLWATLACALATSAGAFSDTASPTYVGENMPAGYTASAFLGTYKTDGSGQFVAFQQHNRTVAIAAKNCDNSGGTVSLAAAVPLNAKTAKGSAAFQTYSGTTTGTVASTSGGIGAQTFNIQFTGGTDVNVLQLPFSDVMLVTAQTIYVSGAIFSANGDSALSISSYTI